MFGISEVNLTTIYIVIGNLVLSAFLTETLRRAGATTSLRRSLGFVLLSWQCFLIWKLTGSGIFSNDITSVTFCLILFGFVGFICATAMSVKSLRNLLLDLSHESLLLPQGLRVFFGAGFLIEGVLGQMPKAFSIADGAFHILSAFFALKAGLLYAQRKDNIGEIWFANIFGLTDIVIVALGIPFSLIGVVGPNHNMMFAAFFAAPLFVLLHVFSLVKLFIERSKSEASKV